MVVLDPTRFREWDSLILSHPNYSVLHSSAWIRVLSASYGYRPLAVVDSGRYPKCAIPVMEVKSVFTGRRGVSIPFSDSLPTLCPDGQGLLAAVEETLLGEARRNNWRYVELRGEPRPSSFRAADRYVEHVIDLGQPDEALCRSLRPSTRRNVERARRAGVAITFSTDERALESYYRLHCVTRRRYGLPPQPMSFFRELREHMIGRGGGVVVVARHGAAPVAGAVFLHFGKRALFKYGASLIESRSMNASSLVMWEAMQRYRAQGYSSLSLGRTRPDNAGLLQFKGGFGGEKREIQYAMWTAVPASQMSRRRHQHGPYALARRLPTALLRVVGSLAYRHFG